MVIRRHEIGSDDIQDYIVDLSVPLLETMNETVNSFVGVNLCSVVEALFESESV
jgi:hypothetical protein